MIYKSSIKKWKKSGKIISGEEKVTIIKNIEKYCLNQNATFGILNELTSLDSKIEYETLGRYGYIHYSIDNMKIKLNWEMSGSEEYDILLAPLNLKNWDEPKGMEILEGERYLILKDLNKFLKAEGIRSDILAVSNEEEIEFEDITCIWAECNNRRIKGMVYCLEHKINTLY